MILWLAFTACKLFESGEIVIPECFPEEEICDGIDNDCNGLVDDEEEILIRGMVEVHRDMDLDGYGFGGSIYFCIVPLLNSYL